MDYKQLFSSIFIDSKDYQMEKLKIMTELYDFLIKHDRDPSPYNENEIELYLKAVQFGLIDHEKT